MDGISRAVERRTLRNMFEEMGHVVDLYISKKQRVGKDVAFGFVRYKHWKEAKNAFKKLNGLSVKNSNLRISVAKYQRDGSRFGRRMFRNDSPAHSTRCTKVPSFRNTRSFSEVRLGKNILSSAEENQETSRTRSVIPVLPSSQVPEFSVETSSSRNNRKSSSPELAKNTTPVPTVQVPDFSESSNLFKLVESVGAQSSSIPVMAENSERSSEKNRCRKEVDTAEETLQKDHQYTEGDALSAVSRAFERGPSHTYTHRQHSQVNLGLKPPKEFSANRGVNQLKVTGRVQNHRDVAMFLGYYTKATKEAAQFCCAR